MADRIKKKTIRDSLTGNRVEVVVSKNGGLYLVEGFNHKFVTSVKPAITPTPANEPRASEKKK